MKKILVLEVIVLIALVIFGAVLLAKENSTPTEPAGTTVTTEPSTEPSAEPTPEPTTEPTTPAWATIPQDRLITAAQYFVYDLNANQYLAATGSGKTQVYPASITKIYSAYLALQHLDPEDLVGVGSELNMVAAGSSVAHIKKGAKLTVSKLVEGMMLPSGNDASHTLAAAAGRVISGKADMGGQTAVKTFVQYMNDMNEKLGLTGSHWVNPDGIHKEQHYTTFDDLVTITRLVLKEDTIMEYAVTVEEKFHNGEELYTWENTNLLVHPESQYYCPYAIGLKTGQTPRAGSCLLSAFDYEGRTIVVGVFGCPEPEDRFADTLQLFSAAVGYTGDGNASVIG